MKAKTAADGALKQGMMTDTKRWMQRIPGVRPVPTLVDVLLTFAVLGSFVAAASTGVTRVLDLSREFPWRAAALCIAGAMPIIWLAARRLAPAGFGAANRVTSIRVSLVALVAAFLGEAYSAAAAWLVVGLTVAILVLDGVDGWLARRAGQASSFGARLDMETDAALTLVLAMLCWQFGKAGAWILAIGLMRYVFVAAAALVPWLGRPLPYSRRRQTICVLQISGLLFVIAPLLPVPLSAAAGVATLVLLGGSFAIDVDWLARQRFRRNDHAGRAGGRERQCEAPGART